MRNLVQIFSFFIFYFSLFTALQAQNLVPNPSFEQYDTCPYNFGGNNLATDWYPFIPNPDYFNACQTIVPADMSVPYNYFGYQQAASGKGYCGFGIYSNDPSDYEQLGCQLIIPLVIGTKYYVSFKVALSDFAEYGYNKIGMRFSTIPYCIHLNSYNNQCDSLPPAPIIDTAQVYCTQIITDTANWTKISGSFIADSAYKYLMIGRMFTNAQSQLVNSVDGIINSYYYVDDVCVSTDSMACNTLDAINILLNEENLIIIYPNPVSDILTIEASQKSTIEITNIQGQLIQIIKTAGSKTSIDVSDFASGVYVVEVRTEKGIEVRKFVKE